MWNKSFKNISKKEFKILKLCHTSSFFIAILLWKKMNLINCDEYILSQLFFYHYFPPIHRNQNPNTNLMKKSNLYFYDVNTIYSHSSFNLYLTKYIYSTLQTLSVWKTLHNILLNTILYIYHIYFIILFTLKR